jgi:hypothetical protein
LAIPDHSASGLIVTGDKILSKVTSWTSTALLPARPPNVIPALVVQLYNYHSNCHYLRLLFLLSFLLISIVGRRSERRGEGATLSAKKVVPPYSFEKSLIK